MHTTLTFEQGIYMALKDKGMGGPTGDPHIHVFFFFCSSTPALRTKLTIEFSLNVIEIKVKLMNSANLAKLMVRELRSI